MRRSVATSRPTFAISRLLITALLLGCSGKEPTGPGRSLGKLAFTSQPSAAAVGAVITPPIQVTAQDAWGNTLTSFGDSVSVRISSNLSGDALSGTATVSGSFCVLVSDVGNLVESVNYTITLTHS